MLLITFVIKLPQMYDSKTRTERLENEAKVQRFWHWVLYDKCD